MDPKEIIEDNLRLVCVQGVDSGTEYYFLLARPEPALYPGKEVSAAELSSYLAQSGSELEYLLATWARQHPREIRRLLEQSRVMNENVEWLRSREMLDEAGDDFYQVTDYQPVSFTDTEGP